MIDEKKSLEKLNESEWVSQDACIIITTGTGESTDIGRVPVKNVTSTLRNNE